MKDSYKVLIIGGGTGGIMTAAQLKKRDQDLNIGLIEPSEYHYYQPAFTLVGAGTFDMKKTKRKEADYIPKGVDWIKDFAVEIKPEENTVILKNGKSIQYEFLVVSPGLVNNLNGIEGMREALETDSVSSNYIDPQKTWKIMNGYKGGGNALYMQPAGAIKCGGAPQKAMYLGEDLFRKKGIREKTNVIFTTPGSVIFGVEGFKQTLENIIEKRNILLKTFHHPVKIDAKKKMIYYKITDEKLSLNDVVDQKIYAVVTDDELIGIPYDVMHVSPPQQAPDFIRSSKLAYQEGANKGWMEVDHHTLQNPNYTNVFGLGDVAALPTAKTGAAIRKQTPVLVDQLISLMKSGKLSDASYSGYSSCPLVTRYGRMVLAEFKYDNVRDSDPLISKFIDTTKEKWSMWILKKYGLPIFVLEQNA